jgi:non-ribosomal peptide synthase protein (TIGR01720 family)
MESHGREDLFPEVDLSRTVGWFTALYPLVLDLTSSEPAELLASVKEELHAVPLGGLGYGLSRYLRNDPEVADLPEVLDRPEVLFNYIGQVDHTMEEGGWKLLPEPQGVERSPECSRPHLLELELMVHGGVLTATWVYSRNIHHAVTIDRLAARYLEVLADLIEHCCSTAAGRSGTKPLAARAQS